MTNVRLAADHLQVQQRNRKEHIEEVIENLLDKEDKGTRMGMMEIAKNWPMEGFK